MYALRISLWTDESSSFWISSVKMVYLNILFWYYNTNCCNVPVQKPHTIPKKRELDFFDSSTDRTANESHSNKQTRRLHEFCGILNRTENGGGALTNIAAALIIILASSLVTETEFLMNIPASVAAQTFASSIMAPGSPIIYVARTHSQATLIPLGWKL